MASSILFQYPLLNVTGTEVVWQPEKSKMDTTWQQQQPSFAMLNMQLQATTFSTASLQKPNLDIDSLTHTLSHSQSNLKEAMAGAVGKGPVSTPDDLPGETTNVTTSLLGMGAKALQSLNPIKRIHAHLCAFHFYAHDMSRQVEAHHYCTHYNQDMRQCLIYDSPEKNARLIGVEYIVSEKLFQGLPEDEKKLWHTHEYEVKGGILFMPGVPKVAENKELDEVAKTYGKVFHFWQYDRGDTLPLGLPQLMMSFTEDGQLNPNLASSVEKRFGVSFKENAEGRKHITGPSMGIHPSSNPWLQGIGLKPELREVDFKDN